MSKLTACFLIFSFFNFKSCEKKTNQWELLKDAAHEIGLCVYNSQETFCTAHNNERSKREASVNIEEEDVYYFEMKEEWVKKRIEDRAGFEKRPSKEYLVLFDIKQGAFMYKDSSIVEQSMSNFLMINLKDNFLFSKRNRSDYYLECFIESDREASILENFLWREYMSGRKGRLMELTSFALINHKEKVLFDKFCEMFYAFQSSVE